MVAWLREVNMTMQLLTEHLLPNEANLIVESSKDSKNMYLKGIFMQAELKNRNGRIYPLSEMVNAVASVQEGIKNNSFLGCLDHPETLTVQLAQVSHLITELKMNGNNAVGTMKILNTPSGLILAELYKGGVRPAVSSRGAGNVNGEGLVEGFNLIAIDAVAHNSAHGANPAVVYEAMQHKIITTLAEQVQQDPDAQKFFKAEILKFIKSIHK